MDAREEVHIATGTEEKDGDEATVPITLQRQLNETPMLFVLRKLVAFCPRYWWCTAFLQVIEVPVGVRVIYLIGCW